MVYINQLYETVEEMRNIYPFKDEDAAIELQPNVCTFGNNLVAVETMDKVTGVRILMQKPIKPKSVSMEDIKCQKR